MIEALPLRPGDDHRFMGKIDSGNSYELYVELESIILILGFVNVSIARAKHITSLEKSIAATPRTRINHAMS